MRTTALLQALRGELPLSEVPRAENARTTDVHIQPADLLPMLHAYLDSKVGAQILQEWASWALVQDEFCVSGWDDDRIADHYEPMWYVLQRISTPFIDGEITRERVQSYVSELHAL